MAKKLDLNKTVYELTQEYPELIEIMAGLGFTEIIKKPMLHSVGKIMTIPKGAKMKNISMMDVVTTLMGKGFELVGEMPDMSSAPQAVPFPVSWTVKMKKKQKETQDILSYHTQAAGCSDKARAKASGGRQPIEECGRTGL